MMPVRGDIWNSAQRTSLCFFLVPCLRICVVFSPILHASLFDFNPCNSYWIKKGSKDMNMWHLFSEFLVKELRSYCHYKLFYNVVGIIKIVYEWICGKLILLWMWKLVCVNWGGVTAVDCYVFSKSAHLCLPVHLWLFCQFFYLSNLCIILSYS